MDAKIATPKVNAVPPILLDKDNSIGGGKAQKGM